MQLFFAHTRRYEELPSSRQTTLYRSPARERGDPATHAAGYTFPPRLKSFASPLSDRPKVSDQNASRFSDLALRTLNSSLHEIPDGLLLVFDTPVSETYAFVMARINVYIIINYITTLCWDVWWS